ncbi:MAG: MOSC domain-containing protein [Actinomycetota bacterium]
MAATPGVEALWRYPVKSMQGHPVDVISVGPLGVVGDRSVGLIDREAGRLASAKRFGRLLEATGHEDEIVLPDGLRVALDAADAADRLSAWLGHAVEPARVGPDTEQQYQMTLDPPNDEAEFFDIPAPKGTFFDWAPVHIVSAATLAHCAAARPDLDWDIRRFRPNIVIGGALEPFAEDGWVGRDLRLGGAVLTVRQPTVRCAMPLRAQPGLERQPGLFSAMNDLNAAFPNHLGVYLDVAEPGEVRIGDAVELV